MKISQIKKLLVAAAISMFVVSCANTNDPSGITKAAGDAAVDAATKNTDPITGAAVRQATGYGTDPTKGILSGLGL